MRYLFGICFLWLILPACATNQPAQRVIALQPSLTEVVCALGYCDRLVGVDRHSRHPPSVRALPQVGGFGDVHIESIVALHPDLVLVNQRNRAVDRMRSLGLHVLVLSTRTLEDIQESLVQIAQALGQAETGEKLWQDTLAKLDRVGKKLPPHWRGARIYLELHDGKAAASQESYLGQILERMGLVSAVPAGMGPFPRLTSEWVLRAAPDALIVSAISMYAPEQRPGWQVLRALQDQRICSLEPEAMDLLLRAGPRLDEAAALILDCLRDLPPP